MPGQPSSIKADHKEAKKQGSNLKYNEINNTPSTVAKQLLQ
jgi:hypothetical protein